MRRIPDRILEDIQQRCDIVDVISGYIPLKKAGRNFKASCPFHNEKTPSFMVCPDKQIFHCFGCAEGGDVFSFIMKYERMEFPEAVRFLADKVGVEIIDDTKEKSTGSYSLTALLYKINEQAAWYFQQNLIKDTRAESARKYLAERKVSKASMEKFRFGLAFEQWDGLLNFLRKKGVKDTLLLKSGLVIQNAQGRLYDRFRDRIILPIFNSQGKIVGFGGRLLEFQQKSEVLAGAAKRQPKYINSPETEIYTKGKNLYGFNFSKEFVSREDYVIIVEGYFDFIIPFQAGIKNLVASSGTAFTSEHVRLLKRYTHHVVIVFDPDVAGEEAALRSLDLLIEEGMGVRIAKLDPGFDPDTYVCRHGEENFRKLIDSAKSLFDYKLDLLLSEFRKEVPEEKAKIAMSMLGLVKKIRNVILRASYIKRLSEILSVSEEVLLIELKKIKILPLPKRILSTAGEVGAYKVTNIAEKMLMSLMFEDARLIKQVKKVMQQDEFSDPVVQKIIKHLFDTNEDELKPTTILNRIDDQRVKSFVCNLAVSDLGVKDKRKSFEDCIRKIKKNKIQTRLNVLQGKIHCAQQYDDEEKIRELLKEYGGLKKEQRSYEKSSKEKDKENS